MHRLETSTTQVNAAWEYLLSKGRSFSKPVNEVTPFNLKAINLSGPHPKPKIILAKNERKAATVKEKILAAKEKLSKKISALFVGF